MRRTRIAALPAHALAMTKPLLRAAADGTWDSTLAMEEFAEPQCFTTSAFQRDYPMIMGLTLLYAALITTVYFVTDLVYAMIDPRVRVGGRGGER